MKDKCVLCHRETAYDYETHIDLRYGYIEGVGQLCKSCYDGNNDTHDVCIPDTVVVNTPNDMELGDKVRRLFWAKQRYPIV